MSTDNDKKNNDGGFGAVFLIVVVLAAMAFVGGGDNPFDRLANLIMICVWIMSIAFLILVLFFIIAYSMRTAMNDLYESLLEDFENSPFRKKIEHYKVIFDEKILCRSHKTAAPNRKTAQQNRKADNGTGEKKDKALLSGLKKTMQPKEKKDPEKELQRQIEEDLISMLEEERNK